MEGEPSRNKRSNPEMYHFEGLGKKPGLEESLRRTRDVQGLCAGFFPFPLIFHKPVSKRKGKVMGL